MNIALADPLGFGHLKVVADDVDHGCTLRHAPDSFESQKETDESRGHHA